MYSVKKLSKLLLALVFIMLVGCSSNEKEYLNYLNPETFIQKLTDKEDGVYLITSSKCSACEIAYDVIIEAAKDSNTVIYTLDAKNEEYEVTNEDVQDMIDILEPTLMLNPETNNKTIYTPHLFSIKNGEIEKSQVGLGEGFVNNDDGLKTLYNRYIDIMKE